MPTISIIIPVYNSSNYLRKCIDSILNQTFKDFEIIFVNDCSTDNSLEILNEYSRKYNFIKIITNDVNRGAGFSRNRGLEIANGVYISFIDSDDWIDESMYEKLVNNIISNKSDMVVAGRYDVYGDGKVIPFIPKMKNLISNEEYLSYLLRCNSVDFSMCNILYKCDLMKGLRFPEGVVCEDILTLYEIIKRCTVVSIIKEPLYFYYHHPDSVTTHAFSPHSFDFLFITKKILLDVQAHLPCVLDEAKNLRLRSIMYTISLEPHISSKDYIHNIRLFKSLNKELKQLKYLMNKNELKTSRLHIIGLYRTKAILSRRYNKMKKKIINIINRVIMKSRCKKLNIQYVDGCSIGKRIKTLGYKPNIILKENARIADDCVLWGGGTIIIGKNSSIGEYGWIHSMAGYKVEIGDNVNFAAFSYLINCDHNTKKGIIIKKQWLCGDDIIIGDDVWIGANVTILKGTIISSGSVIGAGSLVKGKYLDENAVICGKKATVVKYRE